MFSRFSLIKKIILLFFIFTNTMEFGMGKMGMGGISEDEYMGFLQAFAQEYENMSPADKEMMSKELGISTNEMDQLFGEIKTAINETSKEIENKKIDQPNLFMQSSSTNNAPVQKSEIKSFEESLSLLYDSLIKNLFDAVKILDSLISKISASDYLRKNLNNTDKTLILQVKMTVYYLGLLRGSLQNVLSQKNITLPQNELEDLQKNVYVIINELKEPVNALNVDAFNSINSNTANNPNGKNDNLFQKYHARNQKELIDKINQENSKLTLQKNDLEKSINSLSDNDKELIKTYKKSLISLNHKIDDIQEDLQTIQSNSNNYTDTIKEENKNKKKIEDIFYRNANLLTNAVKKVFIDNALNNSIEMWVKKFLPQEFEVGQRRKEAENKRLQEEANIANRAPQSSGRSGFSTENLQSGRGYGGGYGGREGEDYNSMPSNSFFQEIDNDDRSNPSKNDNTENKNSSSGDKDKKSDATSGSGKKDKDSAITKPRGAPSGGPAQPAPAKNKTSNKDNAEKEVYITSEMVLELIDECLSLANEKDELTEKINNNKLSPDVSKKMKEALTAHNNLIKTKLNQLDNFLKKIPLEEFEKKYINSESLTEKKNEEDTSDDNAENAGEEKKTHIIKTWGEKIYTVLSSDSFLSHAFSIFKSRITKLAKKPSWYTTMLKEIALIEAEKEITHASKNDNQENEDQEEGQLK